MKRILVALIAAALIGPSVLAAPQSTSEEKPSSASADPVFGVFKFLTKEHPTDNICISPLNIELALRMVQAGAKGNTKEQLSKLIATGNRTTAGTGGKLALPTKANGAVRVHIGNALITRRDGPFNADFEAMCKSKYAATTFKVGTDPQAIVKVVNDWSSAQTHGMIRKVISEPFDKNLRFAIVSTLYFKGLWQEPFDLIDTTKHSFTTSASAVKVIDALHAERWHYALDTPEMLGLCLPYAADNNHFEDLVSAQPKGRWAMYLFVPKENHKLSELEQQLTAAKLNEWLARFQNQPTTIFVPKYDADYSASLKETLIALGVTDAFDSKADLSGMFPARYRAFLLDVIHKTKMKIDEKGTEAAAVTATTGIGGGASPHETPPERPPLLIAFDRPYLLLIHDNKTGVVLFAAQVSDPASGIAPSAKGTKLRADEEAGERRRWDHYWTEVVAWNAKHPDQLIPVPSAYKDKK